MIKLRKPTTNPDITIKLTKAELLELTKLAKERYNQNRAANNPTITMRKIEEDKTDSDKYRHEVIGLCGELAVLKYLGFSKADHTFTYSQTEFNKIKRTINDVGRVEVRSTHYFNGSLIIKKPDLKYNPDVPFILCVVNLETGTVFIKGWAFPIDAAYPEYIRHSYTTEYFYPAKKLNPINDLPKDYFKK